MASKPLPLDELLNLNGKTAIVTGGAQGIGAAIAFRLAEAGATVVIADKNADQAESTAREIAGGGYHACAFSCDVSIESEVNQLVKNAAETTGGIDILVNNAGIFPSMPLHETTSADFDRVMAVNLRGAFLCCREVSRQMIQQDRGGSIINIASIDAIHPSAAGLIAYDASKSGILGLTRSLALELGKHGIRANAIAPGGIVTEGMKSQIGVLPGQEMKRLKQFLTRSALGRLGRPDEIACVALFLASDLASYITGSLFVADGGYLIS